MKPDYICYECGLMFYEKADYIHHSGRHAAVYSDRWPDPPPKPDPVLDAVAMEEARDDLLDLLRELS